MPLIKSSSDAAFKTNVAEMIRAGHPRDQALAASYRVKRGKADGGPVDPDVQKIMDDNKMRNLVHYYLGKPQGRAMGGPPQMPMQMPPPTMHMPSPTMQPPMQGARPPMAGMPPGGMPMMPPRRFALGGAPAPWFVRNEARSMMHAGPVMSAVPGRTDKHNINVAAGSYVLPADHVSSLGQGNTQAGFATLGRMFGKPMAIPHGHPPPPPRFAPMKMAGFGKRSDEGGSRGDEAGGSVPIVVAGGEFVIPPDKVAEIDGGDLKRGHEVLDHWVKTNREKHIKTLKGLPPPARK